MAELVRVAHDAHGLDAAIDDVDREHAPDMELLWPLRRRLRRSAGGVAGLLDEGGELLGVDIATPQERQRLLGGLALGLAGPALGRAPHEAARLAVDPDPAALELARGRAHLGHGGHEAGDEGCADE